jgi:hypothetical protein
VRKLKGRLQFMGWFNLPWKLVTDDGEIDLWPEVEKFFILLNGKRADHNRAIDGYTLFLDKKAEYEFCYKPDEQVVLNNPDEFGMSNVHAYLESALGWLSGRLVEIEISETALKFTADKSEEVYGVYFSHNNSCKIPDGIEKTICKVGKTDCCIFLSVSSNGFSCEKFNDYTARGLLDRLEKGNIRASRVGNCALLGRKEEAEALTA